MANTLNTEVKRYEAPRKVTGGAKYGGDFMPSGMLHAHLACSDIAVGKLVSIDKSKAEAEEGVIAVFGPGDLPKHEAVKGFYKGGYGTASFAPMVNDEIKYAGQPIAIVVAENAAAARRGAELIKATYEIADASIEMDATKSVLVDAEGMDVTKGDVAKGLAEAAQTVNEEYSTPFQHHNPMELFSTTAEWNGDRLTVWMPTQSVRTTRAGFAKAWGMQEDAVEISSPFVGGAFGSKAGVPPYAMLAIAAAKGVDAPVRLVITRPQMFTVATFRPESVQKFRLGASADGKLTAFEHIEISQTSRFDPVVNPGTHLTRLMYASPNIHTEERLASSDTNTPGFMRAPNEFQSYFGMESAMDELALKLEMDPVEFRRVNDTKNHPVADVPFSSRSLMECYDEAGKTFGWADRDTKPGSMVDGDWLVGFGCATAMYPTAVAPSEARIRMRDDGTALVELASHDVGTGAYTIMGQIAAQRLGLPIDKVEVVMGNSSLPVAPLSGGSVTSASAGSAVHMAALGIASQIAKAVTQNPETPLSGVDPEQVTLEDGVLRGPGGKSMPLLEALKATPRGEVEFVGQYAHPDLSDQKLRVTYKGGYGVAGPVTDKMAMSAFGAEYVEVRVHRWTKEIRVPRIHGAFAAGNILNRKTAHSQLMGGMIWGISSALHEATEVDKKRARFLNTNIAEYLVPVNADVKEVKVSMLDEEDDYVNPLGVKGIGELGIVGTAAAIGNAIHHATGKRLRSLPFKMADMI